MDKYEYLTGEDLNCKPSSVEQAKFDYSPLSQFFNKGLKEEDKKEGLLKRLKNIEDKSEEKLKAIKIKNENMKEVTDFAKEPLSLEAKALIEEMKIIQRDVDYRKLKIIGVNGVPYNFRDYKTFKELFRDIYYRTFKINKAEQKQNAFNVELNALSKYVPRDQKYVQAKNDLLNNTKNFYKRREKIIEGFQNGIFLIYHDYDRRFEDNNENDIRDNNDLIDY